MLSTGPPFWTSESVGTRPSSHPILLPFCGDFCVFHQVFEILESDLFQGNFTIALCSFGGVNYQYSVTSWAAQETRMLHLFSCDNDMTAWLKAEKKGSGVSRARGRPGDTKELIKKISQDHTRAQTDFIAIQGTLLIVERRLYLI